VSVSEQAIQDFGRFFRTERKPFILSVPGRVNLIGEHIDYHNLPVLPIAIQKQIVIAFLPRADQRIFAASEAASDSIEFTSSSPFTPGPPGHWSNYVRAAANVLRSRHALATGIDAFVASDLPLAAGLSSSSALLIAFSLALAKVNQVEMTLTEWTALLPDGEQLVGTRGGAMDHVAILGSWAGFATLIDSFAPLEINYVPIPSNWRFLIADSLVSAEKSGALRSEYNARRAAGSRALEKLGLSSYREALKSRNEPRVGTLADESERNAFLHVTTEARRVQDAALALRQGDSVGFGRLLCESHGSLRDRLRVSLPEIDQLVDSALDAGALGARLTGAGFGGCVVALCTSENVDPVRRRLVETYYAHRSGFNPAAHLFLAQSSSGALCPQALDDADQH
jgi:galactokinase